MKHCNNRRFLTLLAGLLAAVFLLPAGAQAQLVSPTDYDVPNSTAQQLRLSGNYAYAGQEGDTQTNDGSASLVYNRFYNSLPFAYDQTFNGVGSTGRTAAGKQKHQYNFIAESGVRKYYRPEGNLFYSVDGRVTGNSALDRPAIEVTPGVGYGRFIRVTTLAQAVRIEQFLLREQVIKGDLPKETMVELAQIIERRSEFETEYGDRYRVHWFKAMEQAIVKSGRFAGDGLGAVGVLRVEEVLFQERINDRFIGWDVRSGVRFELLTADKALDRQDPSLSLRIRYSRPVNWRSQFDINGQYTSPFNGGFGGDVFTVTGVANYLFELTNKIDYTATNIVTATRQDDNLEASISEQFRTGFMFYLENYINLNLTAQAAKDRGEKLSQGLNLAIEYRLR